MGLLARLGRKGIGRVEDIKNVALGDDVFADVGFYRNQFGKPTEVQWSIRSRVPDDVANRYTEKRRATAQSPRDLRQQVMATADDAVAASTTAVERRKAVAAFKAAERALKEDMARRRFDIWTPESGYTFHGATGKHDDIYARMVARAKHPDYYAQTKDDAWGSTHVFLRRKLPIRHELAAAAAAGVLWPTATGSLPVTPPIVDSSGIRRTRFDVGLDPYFYDQGLR